MTKSEKLIGWLGRVDGHMLLETQVVGSGYSAALNEALLANKVDLVPHPTVIDRKSGIPATAVVLKEQA